MINADDTNIKKAIKWKMKALGLEVENKKLRDCVNELLAIAAHVDPETYNNREAIDWIMREINKCLKEINKSTENTKGNKQ